MNKINILKTKTLNSQALKAITLSIAISTTLSNASLYANPAKSTSNQVLNLKSDARITAYIAKDSMSRIAIVGDRIAQVFGDNEAYELQVEESSGQIFIKPSFENGDKPIPITLVTESGLTQDLNLIPSKNDAQTIIIKTQISAHGSNTDQGFEQGGATPNQANSGFSPYTVQTSYGYMQNPHAYGFANGQAGYQAGYQPGYQEQLVNAIKSMVINATSLQGISLETDFSNFKRVHPAHIKVEITHMYALGGFKGLKVSITNTLNEPSELLEKDFYQTGDLAIYFKERVLKPKSSTTAYILIK